MKKDPQFYLKRSLYMIGRRRELESCRTRMNRVLKLIPAIYTNKEENNRFNEILLIRGTLGSGKSLFIRKFLYEFIEFKDFRQMKYSILKIAKKYHLFLFLSRPQSQTSIQ
jgi:hypothetical protein